MVLRMCKGVSKLARLGRITFLMCAINLSSMNKYDLHFPCNLLFVIRCLGGMCICLCNWLYLFAQIENCNQPFLDVFKQYDDGRDLSDYNFSMDEFGPLADDINKRKLAYRDRLIAHKYKKVWCCSICLSFVISLLKSSVWLSG